MKIMPILDDMQGNILDNILDFIVDQERRNQCPIDQSQRCIRLELGNVVLFWPCFAILPVVARLGTEKCWQVCLFEWLLHGTEAYISYVIGRFQEISSIEKGSMSGNSCRDPLSLEFFLLTCRKDLFQFESLEIPGAPKCIRTWLAPMMRI